MAKKRIFCVSCPQIATRTKKQNASVRTQPFTNNKAISSHHSTYVGNSWAAHYFSFPKIQFSTFLLRRHWMHSFSFGICFFFAYTLQCMGFLFDLYVYEFASIAHTSTQRKHQRKRRLYFRCKAKIMLTTFGVLATCTNDVKRTYE